MNTSSSSNNLESQRQEESSFKLKSRLSSSIENNLISPHYHQHQISRCTSLGSNAGTISLSSPTSFMPHNKNMCGVATGGGGPSFGLDINVDDHDPLGGPSSFVPPPPAVTVVLEGRSICQRISLHKHASYLSLAKALRQMFVLSDDIHAAADGGGGDDDDLNLSNAIPGHLIAYEDMENDLLLAGDLSWRDFVKVAKRIRILPVKKNLRKGRAAGGIN